MKTMGLIGGLSWSSTAVYYRELNERVQARLGGRHSARLVLWSVDFAEHLRLHDAEGWQAVAEETVDIGLRLRAAGADFLMFCVNTLHLVADQVEERVGLPLLHIADATGAAVACAGLKRVSLLGTRHTMREAFYRDRLSVRHGIEVIVPEGTDFQTVDTIIYEELVVDRYEDSSRQAMLEVIGRQVAAGAEGIILGCTELPQLLGDSSLAVPTFDTLRLHAAAAVEEALA